MKCPACHSALYSIIRGRGEWICDNPDCPENKNQDGSAYAEFYGHTQLEIDADYRERRPSG